MKKIYLAGPDIFYPDSDKRKIYLIKLCDKYGFKGIYPGDNDVHPLNAKNIRNANLKLINQCDFMIANLEPFRGLEPDSGTIFEVGYATALNKPVYGYSSDNRHLIDKVRDFQNLKDDDNLDKDQNRIEDFGLPNNLMFGHIVTNTPEEAIKKCRLIKQF